MITFLVFLVFIYLIAIFAVTLPYWYERGNAPCEDIPSAAYAPRSAAKLLMEAAFSMVQLCVAIPLDPVLRHIENADEHEDKTDYPPVLLVHGLYHNPSGWMYMRRALRKAGFRKIHTMAYSSWNTNIEAVTTHLESSVATLEIRYAGRKPILVGHSLGGLIMRNWLAKEENQKRVFGAVTLGAPHRGSKMAALAFGALGKSLFPSNPFFEDLALKEKEATIPCLALVSEADTMVLPQQNLVPVTKGWTMRMTPYATHASLLTKGAVSRMVAWELHRMVADMPKPEPKPEPTAEAKPAPQSTQPEPEPEATAPAVIAQEKPGEAASPTATASPKSAAKTAPKKGKAAPKGGKKPAKK